ncbi:MAG: hypothetical protein LBB14_01805 [Puniceicoccales bacterium]|nr:hypothetical protein [Puniceicoccales bacterium]
MGISRSVSPSTSLWFFALLATPFLNFFLLTASHRARYRHDLGRQNTLLAKQMELKEQAGELEDYLGRFARDGDFRRRVLREWLGYADSGEYVYVFEE